MVREAPGGEGEFADGDGGDLGIALCAIFSIWGGQAVAGVSTLDAYAASRHE